MTYKIKEVRKAKGITQNELAKKAKVSRATICQLESGKDVVVTTNTISQIAKALDVNVSEIFLA